MRSFAHASTAGLVLALALTAGCSAKSGGGTPVEQGSGVQVTPESPSLYRTQSLQFAAAGAGAAQGVDWSVSEGLAGGQITTSGFYTAPDATGTFHVVARSLLDPNLVGTAQVTVLDPPPGGNAMTTAHRTSGVAPLAVFFDAVDDVAASSPNRTFPWTSNVNQPADREATLYAWDFGDPGSGTWTTTGRSKNTATGYTAAHVYETPGTYTVTLTQTDPAGTVRTYSQQITVSAFSGTTYYVAANGNDSANGTSTSTPFLTLDRAMRAALAASGPVQVLFRRGDSFAATTGYAITKAGPGLIGAYGTGTTRPIINVADIGDAQLFSPRVPSAGGGAYVPGTGGSDWRVVDLDFRTALTNTGSAAVGPPNFMQGKDLLVLRSRGQGFRDSAFGWGDASAIDPYPHDGIFIVDSESTAPSGDYGAFIGGRRIAVLGSDIHDIGASHVLRVWLMHKGVISNNRLFNPGPTRHALKLHSTLVGDGRAESRWVTISDNLIRGKVWSAVIGAQDNGSAERPSHIVFERNRFTAEASVNVDLRVHSCANIMVRNNVLDGRGANTGYIGIQITNYGGALANGDRVRVLNNTISRLETSEDFTGVEVSNGMTNVTVRNNLVAPGGATAPHGTDGIDTNGAGAGLVTDHNLSTATPGFTGAAAGDFSISATSPALDAGATLPEVREDYGRAPRPAGSGHDLGAYERP